MATANVGPLGSFGSSFFGAGSVVVAQATAKATKEEGITHRNEAFAWRIFKLGVPVGTVEFVEASCLEHEEREVRGDLEASMRFLFLMDPMETVQAAKDTTFALMLAASARGHECFHALPLALETDRGVPSVRAARVRVDGGQKPDGSDGSWKLDTRDKHALEAFDAVLIRKDPPFDANYAYMTQILEAARGKTLVVNDPRGLRDANEKLYSIHFSRWAPRTLVTATPHHIRDFVHDVGGQAVIKPLDGMAGSGIFLLREDDKNFNAIVEARIGEFGNTFCMVQEYLPAAREGDKRILLLDGEPLGAILRVPRADEARANIHVGGRVVKAEITAHEREMITDIAPRLRADGLYFVGLDVIGGKLTEVNVTSPTGIQQMQRMDGVDYSGRVIEWVEKRAKK